MRSAPMVALAFLASACATDNVVVEPVAFQKVPKTLMQPVRQPSCELDGRASDYSTEEIKASLDCWTKAFDAAKARHDGLRQSIAKREAAIDAAKAAAKN